MPDMKSKDKLRLSNEESNQLTRECLCTALMKLMGDSALEEISINAIVDLAGVSRMAFYRNYGTKEALAEELCLKLAIELEQDFKEGFAVEETKMEKPEGAKRKVEVKVKTPFTYDNIKYTKYTIKFK